MIRFSSIIVKLSQVGHDQFTIRHSQKFSRTSHIFNGNSA